MIPSRRTVWEVNQLVVGRGPRRLLTVSPIRMRRFFGKVERKVTADGLSGIFPTFSAPTRVEGSTGNHHVLTVFTDARLGRPRNRDASQ